MPICTECQTSFIVNIYLAVCDSCGAQIERHYAELQEFKAHHLNMMELSSHVVFKERIVSERRWRIG